MLLIVLLQDVVENWELYEDKLGSMKELLDSTQTSLTDEGYLTLSTTELEQHKDQSLATSLQVAILVKILFSLIVL